MATDSQQNNSESLNLQALSEEISPLRLGTYLNATGHDAGRALRLYLWNAQVGEAFHIPIQSVEVGLRNRVNAGLTLSFGEEWWQSPGFLAIAESKRRSDIDLVKRRLISKKKPIETGQVVAGLSFGFWVAMIHRRYMPGIWSQQLRRAFPHLPDHVDHRRLHQDVQKIADLRNRIWHHEPIFARDLSTDHARCMRVTAWLCPTKAAWIKPYCRFHKILRQKP